MLASPPHFEAFDPSKPVTIYRRNLPHWRQSGATYFVTFRLVDSIPSAVSERLRQVAADEAERTSIEAEREWFRCYDEALDGGHGSCLLGLVHHRQIVCRALQFFNDPGDDQLRDHELKQIRYRMGAYVVMGNHVHVLIQPTLPDEFPLETILGGWKSFTAKKINGIDGQKGRKVWAEESYDRIVRGTEELHRSLQYIGRNPARAGLGPDRTERWVAPQWQAAGWGFRGNR